MRLWNRLDAALYAHGWATPSRAAVLEVPGPRSGRVRSVPVVIADVDGADHVVSMCQNKGLDPPEFADCFGPAA